jgi:hypothetical protein
MTRSARIFTFFLMLSGSSVFGQQNGLGNSPYSMYGVGDLIWNGPTRNMGMGGVGVASPAENFVNLMNPALLVYSKAASFEMAALGQYKVIQTRDEWQTTTGGTIHYGVFAIPLHKRWTASLGILPFSEISYEKRYSGDVEGNPGVQFLVKETGIGGLNKVFFGNGFRISKNFSLGAEGIYFFGNKDELSLISLNLPGASIDGIRNFYYFRALNLNLGGFFQSVLDSARNVNIGVGLTYNLSSGLKTDLTTTREKQATSVITFPVDTFGQGSLEVGIPEEIKLGLSFFKPQKWSINVDISYVPWETFVFEGKNAGLRNSLNFFVGGEYVPNPMSITSMFARAYYRIGAYYRQPPFPYNGQFIEDYGINFGVSLPVTKFAFLNFAIMVGQRGTTDYGLVLEKYNRFSLGLVINDRNWFKRFKLE